MAKYKIKACWLLLAVLLIVFGAVFSVGVTQARYHDRNTAKAVVQSPDIGVTSNCLVTEQDAPRTVLLGEMDLDGSMTVPFWLLSSNEDAVQRLNWGIADSNYKDYLNISVFMGYERLFANSDVKLIEDVKLDLLLCIEPTQLAIETPHEKLKILVHVTWGDQMWGTFQVMLPEVVEKLDSDLQDGAFPGLGEEMTTESAIDPATEPSTEPPVETTTESPVETTTEPPIETTTEPPTETPTEPPTETTTEPPTETTTEPPVETTTEPPTETTEPTTETDTDAEIGIVDMAGKENLIQLNTIHAVHPSELLPVRIELPEGITAIRLGVQTAYGDNGEVASFPDYTMFSLDGGASYYMLYGEVIPEFVLENVMDIPLLLDFSYTEMACKDEASGGQKTINLAMETYVGDELFKTQSSTVAFNQEPSGIPTVWPQELQTDGEAVTVISDAENQRLGPILTFDNQLYVEFPIEWEEAELQYSVEYLTMTEDEKLEYIPVTPTQDGLYFEYIRDAETHKLEFRLGDRFMTPGTYRLNLTWTYEGISFIDTQITFFIHYAVSADEALSS